MVNCVIDTNDCNEAVLRCMSWIMEMQLTGFSKGFKRLVLSFSYSFFFLSVLIFYKLRPYVFVHVPFHLISVPLFRDDKRVRGDACCPANILKCRTPE